MIIIPAIDMIGGKCVRLTEGKFTEKTEYSHDPIDQAFMFKDMGASRIHLIDLDGASTGTGSNRKIIKDIKQKTGLIVETGGGIRTEDDIKELADSGIDHVILGTMLVEQFELISSLAGEYGEVFIAGIDVKDGSVKTRGWQEGKGLDPKEFGIKVAGAGIKTAVFTDISKDGKLQGPNIEATCAFAKDTGLQVILSGGISCIEDIEKVSLEKENIFGVIIGKAYYEGRIDVKKTIELYEN